MQFDPTRSVGYTSLYNSHGGEGKGHWGQMEIIPGSKFLRKEPDQ